MDTIKNTMGYIANVFAQLKDKNDIVENVYSRLLCWTLSISVFVLKLSVDTKKKKNQG